MKLPLALVCSLMLIWTQIVLAAPAPACGGEHVPRACCQGCHQASCCAANNSPESQSLPVAPVSASSQNQISFFMAAAPAWALPKIAPREFSPSASPFVLMAEAPLYERNCALLL